jgi:hypothetical protein
MNRDERHEELLWEMSRSDDIEDSGGSDGSDRVGPDDATLRAWREGRLGEDEARAVEAALAASPEARERLAALAGVEAQAPPAELRRRTLRRFGPAEATGGGRWWRPVVALAASLVVAVGLLQLFGAGEPDPLPGDLAFDVAVRGLTDTRGAVTDTGAEPATAYPETPLRFAVTPRGAAVADLDFAIYREAPGGERLVRVADSDPESGLTTIRVDRGAATLTAPASDLTGPLNGSAPGRHTLFVVVARRGDLPPEELEVGGDEPAALLHDGGRRLVYPRPIELLPPGSGARDATGPEG